MRRIYSLFYLKIITFGTLIIISYFSLYAIEEMNFYEVLGVPNGIPQYELDKKITAEMSKYHPEKNIGKSQKVAKEAQAQFEKLSEIKTALGNPENRFFYDLSLQGEASILEEVKLKPGEEANKTIEKHGGMIDYYINTSRQNNIPGDQTIVDLYQTNFTDERFRQFLKSSGINDWNPAFAKRALEKHLKNLVFMVYSPEGKELFESKKFYTILLESMSQNTLPGEMLDIYHSFILYNKNFEKELFERLRSDSTSSRQKANILYTLTHSKSKIYEANTVEKHKELLEKIVKETQDLGGYLKIRTELLEMAYKYPMGSRNNIEILKTVMSMTDGNMRPEVVNLLIDAYKKMDKYSDMDEVIQRQNSIIEFMLQVKNPEYWSQLYHSQASAKSLVLSGNKVPDITDFLLSVLDEEASSRLKYFDLQDRKHMIYRFFYHIDGEVSAKVLERLLNDFKIYTKQNYGGNLHLEDEKLIEYFDAIKKSPSKAKYFVEMVLNSSLNNQAKGHAIILLQARYNDIKSFDVELAKSVKLAIEKISTDPNIFKGYELALKANPVIGTRATFKYLENEPIGDEEFGEKLILMLKEAKMDSRDVNELKDFMKSPEYQKHYSALKVTNGNEIPTDDLQDCLTQSLVRKKTD